MRRLLLVSILVLCVAAMAHAQTLPDIAIALHVDNNDGTVPSFCNEFVTSWDYMFVPSYFYVMICGHLYAPPAAGFQGVEYGLTWPLDWMWCGWTSYADIAFGDIVAPGDGTIGAWADCQDETHPYLAGILCLMPMSPGRVSVTVHPDSGVAQVADCDAVASLVLPIPMGNGRAGWVDVLMGPGCNPCPCWGPPCHPEYSPVESQSWGTIKALYQ